MTASDWRKQLKQYVNKTAIRQKYIKHNKPKVRTCGITKKKCERCGRYGAMINKYGLNLCRHCFREIATELGFKKFS
ncbi:30S ribosomal protein S14 [Candidatus Pacearchaeota archaeon]|nr:30S ribosomal protein S14 [Candidatus Pacearchaeota archaeon]